MLVGIILLFLTVFQRTKYFSVKTLKTKIIKRKIKFKFDCITQR